MKHSRNRRILCLLLAVAALGSLAACGGGGEAPSQPASSEEPAPPAEPEGYDALGPLIMFSYGYGDYFTGYYDYTVYDTADGVMLEAYGSNGVELNVEKTVPDETLEELRALIGEAGIDAWDGFDEKDEEIMDGYSFNLKAQYQNGTLAAEGYMKEPEGYEAGHQALVDFLEKLAN